MSCVFNSARSRIRLIWTAVSVCTNHLMRYLVAWHWNYLALSWAEYYIPIVNRHELFSLFGPTEPSVLRGGGRLSQSLGGGRQAGGSTSQITACCRRSARKCRGASHPWAECRC